MRGAGGTPAVAALIALDIAFVLHPYEHDPATTAYGDEAAAALGIDPGRVFKTLIVSAGGLAVGVLPVARRLDLKAMAGVIGAKRVELAEPAVAKRATGYVLGGISPFGQRSRLPTVLDIAALDFTTILVSAGRRGLQVELAPSDVLRATAGVSAPIARPL